MVDDKVLVAIIAAYMYEFSKKKPIKFKVSKITRINSWKIAARMDIFRWRL